MEDRRAVNKDPIVFVHGMLGWGRDKMAGLPFFGVADLGVALGRMLSLDLGWSHRAIFPSVGPLSSNHDRACELFYKLKGGDVHYGAAHARENGHREIRATGEAAMFPEWDSEHPVHFVGQAQGASTVRLLQHLLARGDFFPGYSTRADWVKSITSISGIHNGTPVTYIAGCSLENGRIQRYSTAEFLTSTLLNAGAEHRFFYSLDLEQWDDQDVFMYGKDNAIFDLSIHGAQEMDFVEDQDCTYYFSYVTCLPANGVDVLFRYPARQMGRFTGPLQGLRYPIADYAEWWENDGLAPVYTQEFPRWGTPRTPALPEPVLRKGVWYQMGRLEMNHMNPVALPRVSWTLEQQRELVGFYRGLYELLAAL